MRTAGDWRWFNYPDGRKLLAGLDRAVIHCPDAPMTVGPEDQALIAAAPDLLAAAVEAENWLDNHGDPDDPGAMGLLSMFRAAIKKTESQ
jgi:hypothetical protein